MTVGKALGHSGSFKTRLSYRGFRYRVWEADLPRIAPYILDASFFMYPSRDEALSGSSVGGSGFLVSVPLAIEPYVQVYAVTNQHVLDGNCLTLRLNTRDGVDVIESVLSSWWGHPVDDDDLAVLPIDLAHEHRWSAIDCATFATEDMFPTHKIGIGDDVLMFGRLITREGSKENKPIVRFGHVSGPPDYIERGDGKSPQLSVFVECRSVSGFSGSPVFVWHEPGQKVMLNFGGSVGLMDTARAGGMWLLGVDFCHIPLYTKVKERKNGALYKTQYRAEQNTGVAGVIPAWRLRDILFREELVAQRKQAEDDAKKQTPEAEAIYDTNAPDDDSTFTRADFEAALKRASRKLSDEEKSET